LYQQNLDLIQVGAYQAGANPDLDEAIRLRPEMEVFLRQGMHDNEPFPKTQEEMVKLMKSGGVEVMDAAKSPGNARGPQPAQPKNTKAAASVRFSKSTA